MQTVLVVCGLELFTLIPREKVLPQSFSLKVYPNLVLPNEILSVTVVYSWGSRLPSNQQSNNQLNDVPWLLVGEGGVLYYCISFSDHVQYF